MKFQPFSLETLYFALLGALLQPIRVVNASRCELSPSQNGSDDSASIISAFNECKKDSTIVFTNGTYHIESVMQTTGMQNIFVDFGESTLLWGTNLSYWINNSLPLDYQNQSTAWILGGNNITLNGNNAATFDGNGQLWYDFANGTSNLAGRPINLVVWNTTNSVVRDLRFVQSQFWTMAIRNSENMLLENIYINSTSSNSSPTQNTDGVDTFYANNITFRNWTVICGDDNISTKANSTNILIQDSTFFTGDGIAIGSIGQYPGVFERIENVTAERVKLFGTAQAAYIKTWTGVQRNFPPNGGGGGLGDAKNLTFRDITISDLVNAPFSITQCNSYSGAKGGCDTSLFKISNITIGPMKGSTRSSELAVMQCSGAAPCEALNFVDFDVQTSGATPSAQCNNTVAVEGLNCTSPVPPQ